MDSCKVGGIHISNVSPYGHPPGFLASLESPHPKVIMDALVSKTNPTGGEIWALRNEFIHQLKADFSNFGKRMSEIRKTMLEKWTEFVNPYHRLRRAMDQLYEEVTALSLDPSKEALPDLIDSSDSDAFKAQWKEVAERYSKGFGICFGIRSMLPVMAEAFVNLLLFILMKADIKE